MSRRPRIEHLRILLHTTRRGVSARLKSRVGDLVLCNSDTLRFAQRICAFDFLLRELGRGSSSHGGARFSGAPKAAACN